MMSIRARIASLLLGALTAFASVSVGLTSEGVGRKSAVAGDAAREASHQLRALQLSDKGSLDLQARLLSERTDAPLAEETRVPTAGNRPLKSALVRSDKAIVGTAVGDRYAGFLETATRHLPVGSKRAESGSAAGMAPEMESAIDRLKSSDWARDGVSMTLNANTDTAARVRLSTATKPRWKSGDDGEAERRARLFLDSHADLFGIDEEDGGLMLRRTERDGLGMLHVTYQQTYQGHPVYGRVVRTHLDPSGRIYLIQADTVRDTELPDTRSLYNADALRHGLQQQLPAPDADIADHGLRYLALGETRALTRLFDVQSAPTERKWVFVDVRSGEVVWELDRVHQAGTVVTAEGLDVHGEPREFGAWLESGTYHLIDPSAPDDTGPFDPLVTGIESTRDSVVFDLNGQTDSSQQEVAASLAQTSGWDPVAVSAAANTQVVYEYFRDELDRDSLDDAGKSLISLIHYGQAVENASWNGTVMIYGDGGSVFEPLASCLDVVAHELTHGVIEHSANLAYEFQSGALNESFADVFAALVDGDWLLGEDCTAAQPGFLRSMEDPRQGLTPQPAHMSDYESLPASSDHGGVHTNSGIPNRAAYLIAEGLSDEGLGESIGRERTRDLYYRALTVYLTAFAKFSDLRAALEQSAADLYPDDSSVLAAVEDAFDAVGVTNDSGSDTEGPTDTDPITSDNFMVYNFPQDGLHDEPAEPFDVYAQLIADPFPGYDGSLDFGPLNQSQAAQWTRPAAFTLGDGTYVLYIGQDFNAYLVQPDGTEVALSDTSDIWSIAVSPNGSRLAFTTVFANDNNIYVIDVENEGIESFPIRHVTYQDDDVSVNTVQFADALAFNYKGDSIVFDALHCLNTEAGSCNTGDGITYWSIGTLDLDTGDLYFPFPSQPVELNIGFPVFASNNDYILAFDVLDRTQLADTGVLDSYIVIADLKAAELADQVYRGAFPDDPESWGIPSFAADDDHMTFLFTDGTFPNTAFQMPVSDAWVTDPASAEALNPFAVDAPIMHGAQERVVDARIEPSTTSVEFGLVEKGASRNRDIEFANVGNADVDILSISVAPQAFDHTLVTGPLRRGETLSGTITLAAPTEPGSLAGTLSVETDGDPATIEVTVSAQVEADSGELSMTQDAVTVAEDAGGVTLSVSRSDGTDGEVSVLVETTGITAVAGDDFEAVSQRLTWNDGEGGEKSVEVSFLDDSEDEDDEQFSLVLSDAQGGANIGSRDETIVTVTDDDEPQDTGGGSSGGGSGGTNGGGGGPIAPLFLLLLALSCLSWSVGRSRVKLF